MPGGASVLNLVFPLTPIENPWENEGFAIEVRDILIVSPEQKERLSGKRNGFPIPFKNLGKMK